MCTVNYEYERTRWIALLTMSMMIAHTLPAFEVTKKKNEKKKKSDKVNDKRSQAELNWNGNGNRAPRDGTRPQWTHTNVFTVIVIISLSVCYTSMLNLPSPVYTMYIFSVLWTVCVWCMYFLIKIIWLALSCVARTQWVLKRRYGSHSYLNFAYYVLLLAVSEMNKQTSTQVMRQSSFSASLIYLSFVLLPFSVIHSAKVHATGNDSTTSVIFIYFLHILWHIEIAIFQINNKQCMVVSLLWRAAGSASTNENRIIFRQMFGATTAEWSKERKKNAGTARRIYKCLPSANGWSPI